jgi:hypothetical protein
MYNVPSITFILITWWNVNSLTGYFVFLKINFACFICFSVAIQPFQFVFVVHCIFQFDSKALERTQQGFCLYLSYTF